jgi:hypothetical protein
MPSDQSRNQPDLPDDGASLTSPPADATPASIQTLLETMLERQEGQGEILSFIAKCVAPKGDDSGEKLSELLATLIGRIDRQTALIHSLIVEFVRLGRKLPLDIVRAIDDNLGVAPSTPAPDGRANGNGHDRP